MFWFRLKWPLTVKRCKKTNTVKNPKTCEISFVIHWKPCSSSYTPLPLWNEIVNFVENYKVLLPRLFITFMSEHRGEMCVCVVYVHC